MWRGLTSLFAALFASAGCLMVPAVARPSALYTYSFVSILRHDDPEKPEPGIDAGQSSAYRACRNDPQVTTYSLEMCQITEMKLQDSALNLQWATTLARLGPDRVSILRAAERNWIKARNAHCNRKADEYAGGTMAPVLYGSCMIDETIRRTIWLEKLR